MVVNAVTHDAPEASKDRVQECAVSASFWAVEIGPYADRMRKRADIYAIVAALLSTLTGLGAWSILAASEQLFAVLAVSAVALIAAAVAVIPQIRGYGVCAEKAAALGPRYGHVHGLLVDALARFNKNDPEAGRLAFPVVEEFEKVRDEKEDLKPYPNDLKRKIDDQRKKTT